MLNNLPSFLTFAPPWASALGFDIISCSLFWNKVFSVLSSERPFLTCFHLIVLCSCSCLVAAMCILRKSHFYWMKSHRNPFNSSLCWWWWWANEGRFSIYLTVQILLLWHLASFGNTFRTRQHNMYCPYLTSSSFAWHYSTCKCVFCSVKRL